MREGGRQAGGGKGEGGRGRGSSVPSEFGQKWRETSERASGAKEATQRLDMLIFFGNIVEVYLGHGIFFPPERVKEQSRN